VEHGRAIRTNDFEVAHMHRFKPGSGLPVRIPVVDLIEIGAGGGSIAKRTAVGTMQVGPESSSAQPGPACYGQGGTLPTVSDADLVLGYLDPEHFLGGRMKLDRDAAVAAIRTHLAEPIGISVEEAAFGVHAIVNENMASAAKAYASEKGENPKSCALVGFGGAGPVHACDLAARLAIETVLIPPRAGVAAAFGMIVAPVTYDAVRSRRLLLSRITPEVLEQVKGELIAECRERMPSTVDRNAISYEFSVDMRYVGQGYDVNAVVPAKLGAADAVDTMRAAFERKYLKLYGRTFPSAALEVMNFRLAASAQRKVVDLPAPSADSGKDDGRIGSRRAFCARTRTWKEFSVHRRSDIAPGVHFPGPAIVEENESTTVIHSGAYAHTDRNGSLIIKLEPARSNA
jgi:N-methylhydantoinase A